MVRIVFMGTPAFAVPALDRLVGSRYAVVAVYAAPDRPAGRGLKLLPPAAKSRARELGLRVVQPPRLRDPAAVEELRGLEPDLIVVAAYGQILSQTVLDIPPHGCLNIHPSLLPRHRGAAPVAGAILAGDIETGVTIMLVDRGMDTGPILAQRRLPLGGRETTGELTATLAEMGADLLLETLPGWLGGKLRPQPQQESKATYTRPIRKEQGELDWSRPAKELERWVRAYSPWPSAFTRWQGRHLKVLEAEVRSGPSVGDVGVVLGVPLKEAGNVLFPAVQTSDGVLLLKRLQLEGKKALAGDVFLLGQRGFPGSRLSS